MYKKIRCCFAKRKTFNYKVHSRKSFTAVNYFEGKNFFFGFSERKIYAVCTQQNKLNVKNKCT